MNTSTYKSLYKSLTLLSLLAFFVAPIGVSAAVYGMPVTINHPAPRIGESFGISVSISNNNVLIGIRNTSYASLFDATTGALLQTFNSPTGGEHDHFGWSVSISSDKILIGAHNDNTVA